LADRLGHAFDEVVPERNVGGVEFEREKIGDGGAVVCRDQSAYWTADIVRRDGHTVNVRKLGDRLGDGEPADFLQVGSNDADGVFGDHFLKTFEEEKIFAGGDGNANFG